MKFNLIIILLIGFMACKSSKNGVAQTPLLKEWKVSHEEGDREHIVLRPSTFNFPLSRMRDEFIFHKDQTVTYNTLGPADRPLTKKGRWEWVDEDQLKIYIDENNTFYWQVDELSGEVLRVTKGDSKSN